MHRLALLLLLLLLAACTPRVLQTARTDKLDFAAPRPDVVILSVSGRCSQPCMAPRDNWDYLSARGTLDLLADTIAAQGYRVVVAGYAAHPAARFESPFLKVEQRGYAQLRQDYQRIYQQWMTGPHPTRVVLLGHSQGATWLHHLVDMHPDIPVALQVDLDSICVAWASDFRTAIRELDMSAWNEPSPLDACSPIQVAGGHYRLKDIVWPQVAFALEVQSKRLPARTGTGGGLAVNYMFNLSHDIRLDGTHSGIQRFISAREDHSAITRPQSEGMQWVVNQTEQIVQGWKLLDGRTSGK